MFRTAADPHVRYAGAQGGPVSAPRWDVAIAGGGMVGLALALALDTAAAGRLRILLVERGRLPAGGNPPAGPGFDARSTALSRGSELILRDIGVWSELQPHTAAIRRIHVSQRGGAGSIELRAEQHGWPALGHVAENAWLGRVLLAAVRTRPAIELRDGQLLQQPRLKPDCVALRAGAVDAIECAEPALEARLLCIADGMDSSLAATLGIGSERHPYQRVALIANIATEHPHGHCAYERFTHHGPLALLPLPPHSGQARSALVWSLPPARAAELAALPEAAFLAELQRTFGYRQGRLLACGARATFPLVRSLVREQVRSRVVVVGNAAHALHPVAGQGFNLALRDVAALAARLAEAEDPGNLAVLQDYYRRRIPDQERIVALSHHLPGVFGLSVPGLGSLRGLGLAAMDLLPAAKQRFVDLAAGCSPDAVHGGASD